MNATARREIRLARKEIERLRRLPVVPGWETFRAYCIEQQEHIIASYIY